MVRLILVLAPISCVLGAIGLSSTLKTYMRFLARDPNPSSKKKEVSYPGQQQVAVIVIVVFTTLMVFYSLHCTWVTSEAYSSPSIVLAARQHDGSQTIFDDFREAYYWLRQNTAEDARIMSWWDYGYQLAAMANRTVLVDNNTWNNSHIAQVGKVHNTHTHTHTHTLSLSLCLSLSLSLSLCLLYLSVYLVVCQ
jgi:dolichyl-diphosphooligosaccharide---protein glycosyltransferase